jgi:hypothetical protein
MSGEPFQIQPLHGVSLPAFLQLLEHERSTCTLTVAAKGKNGRFFFRDGQLIDAACDGKAGAEAAHILLALKKPDFSVCASEDRMTRIHQPLARILLQAQDKAGLSGPVAETLPGEDAFADEVKSSPLLLHLLAELTAIPAVKHYCLLNRKGKVAACSTHNTQFCNFISYTIMCSLQVRKGLGGDVKGPNCIQMLLRSGDALLIQPGAGMIIGLLADSNAKLAELSAKIRAMLAH